MRGAILNGMRRTNETAADWYARVVGDRDAAAAKLDSLTVPVGEMCPGEADPVDPGAPEQEAAMRRVEQLRLETIEAEAAMTNEVDPEN